ncbi:hypothetical protein NW754_008460 [Fusarium falciforme]|nr:hypothetical protein NW754_008460 [Fusarium falciforme]
MEAVVDDRPKSELPIDGEEEPHAEGEKNLDLEQTQDQDQVPDPSHDEPQEDQQASSVIDTQTPDDQVATIDFVTLGMFIIDDIDFVPLRRRSRTSSVALAPIPP